MRGRPTAQPENKRDAPRMDASRFSAELSRPVLALLLALAAASCRHPPPPANPHYVLGAPYQADGVWYYPRESYQLQETGVATVYPSGHADLTADGEAFDQTALAAAHQTLQLPVDRAPDESGERAAGTGADQRPGTGDAAPTDRGHTSHGDAARLPSRWRGARAAAGAADRELRGRRRGARRAEAGSLDGAARGGAAERIASARRRGAGDRRRGALASRSPGSSGRIDRPAVARGGDPGITRSRQSVRATRHVPDLRNTPTSSVRTSPGSARASSAPARDGSRRTVSSSGRSRRCSRPTRCWTRCCLRE